MTGTLNQLYISIHALCEEGDSGVCPLHRHGRFLSTPSARRATGQRGPKTPDECISIHALCEEGDLFSKNMVQ